VELAIARRVGVSQAERVRLLTVPAVPLPEFLVLAHLAVGQGLIGPQTAGMQAFLPLYLQQIAEVTYERAPYEIDARAWEQVGP
jgi:hypothetical protein